MENKATKPRRRFFKLVLPLVSIGIAGLVLFFVFNPRKAIRLVFPDLNKINYVNAVIKNDSAYTTLNVILENKNPYKLVIDTLFYEIDLNDSMVASQSIPLALNQSAFDEDTVKLPLDLSIKKIKSVIRQAQADDSSSFRAKGYLVYETLFGRVKLDFNKESRIITPVPPRFKIIKVERKKFSYKDKLLKAVATLQITNEGKVLDLQLAGIHYDLTVKNTLHCNGRINRVINIKPGASLTIGIPMDIEIYHPLKTTWLIRTDHDRLPYTLKLTGLIKENVSENAFMSPTEITATGMMELQK